MEIRRRLTDDMDFACNLTPEELEKACQEYMRGVYRREVEHCVEVSDDDLYFSFVISKENFIDECVDELMANAFPLYAEEDAHDTVNNLATDHGIWMYKN